MTSAACVVCGGPVQPRITAWTLRCPRCATWRSRLSVQINTSLEERVDVEARISGFELLRRHNARQILAALGGRALAGSRLLDVGSAYGWFLEEAALLGIDASGAEPDEAVAAVPVARGLQVHVGYFPEAVPDAERFDTVTFNDVLEHIPDVRGALAAVHRMLAPGGRLVINIPNAKGLAYRAGCALARVGVSGPYERLWQRDLPSPHMHYFTPSALATLVRDCGYEVDSVRSLTSISRRGLWERLHTIRRPSPASIALFSALWAAADVLNRPACSDIFLLVARRAV